MKLNQLRWCPDCGQVELDDPEVNLQVIRRGDTRCTTPIEEWMRGTAEDCNRYIGARFPTLDEAKVRFRAASEKAKTGGR